MGEYADEFGDIDPLFGRTPTWRMDEAESPLFYGSPPAVDDTQPIRRLAVA